LVTAIERVFPRSLRQRSFIHRLRNAAAEVSEADLDTFRADWWDFDHIEEPPGDAGVEETPG
jgi:transposase-like protein